MICFCGQCMEGPSLEMGESTEYSEAKLLRGLGRSYQEGPQVPGAGFIFSFFWLILKIIATLTLMSQ